MSEDLYRLISTGLLGVIVLLLLLAVSQLGRLHRSLSAGKEPGGPEPTEPEPERTEAVADEPAVTSETPAAEEDTGSTAEVSEPTAPDEEGPFERDGRWWFRRDGDLLVYDEQLEEWVDPNAAPAAQPEQAAVPDPEPVVAPEPAVEAAPEVQPHPLDEAREWTAGTGTAPVAETIPIEQASPAPIPEPVSAPAPITETTEGAQGEGATHWKCPACGVINGSTASSCRMCFAARP